MLHSALPARGRVRDADLILTRDFLLSLIERADVRRLRNGHLRLVLPVTHADLDALATLGSAAAELEDDTPVEEEPDREEDDPGEEDHRDGFETMIGIRVPMRVRPAPAHSPCSFAGGWKAVRE